MSKVDSKRRWLSVMEGENEESTTVKSRLRSGNGSMESLNSRKRSKPNNKNESDKPSRPAKKPLEIETDPSVLQRRQKQIDYGKNTVGYMNYLQQVPIDKRTKEHPKTPEKYTKYSRRSWDTLIKMWRKKLHEYDTEASKDEELEEYSDTDEEIMKNSL